MSKQLIDQITQVTSGSAVFVGSVSRYYNGVTGSYSDVDTWIPSSSLQALKDNFTVLDSQTNWTGIIDQAFLIYYNSGSGKRYHDVFVSENEPSSSLISGSKFQTSEYDLHIHRLASSSIGSQYLHDKVQMLETLYGV